LYQESVSNEIENEISSWEGGSRISMTSIGSKDNLESDLKLFNNQSYSSSDNSLDNYLRAPN